MTTKNYSRAVNVDIIIREDRLFDATFTFSRSDDAAVDFDSVVVKMDIYSDRKKDPIYELTESDGISVNSDSITINKILGDLAVKSYYFKLYNDTDKIDMAYGEIIVQ